MENKTKRQRTSGNFDERLSPCEQLLIIRRRNGWNQGDAAAHYKVSLFTYKMAEYGKLETLKTARRVLYLSLSDSEKCLIYRKRSGLSQKVAAAKMGIGREWFRLQELGKVPCGKLLAWWESYETNS